MEKHVTSLELSKRLKALEKWKDIEGYEGLYMVSNMGRIMSLPRSTTSGKILKDHIVKGYRFTCLSKNNKRKSFQIHRLVLIAFKGLDKKRTYVNHKNFRKYDNRLSNLEWVTAKENSQHALKHGAQMGNIGERHPMAKLTREQVLVIKGRISKGDMISYIASDFGVSIQCISDIKNKRRWAYLHA